MRQTSGRDLKHTALQPDSKEMTEALKTLLNYCVVPLVSDEYPHACALRPKPDENGGQSEI